MVLPIACWDTKIASWAMLFALFWEKKIDFGNNFFTKVQSNLYISNSNSAKIEVSIWIKNTFWLLSPTIIWRCRLLYKSKLPEVHRVIWTCKKKSHQLRDIEIWLYNAGDKQFGAKMRSYICVTWSCTKPVCNFTKVLLNQYLEWHGLKTESYHVNIVFKERILSALFISRALIIHACTVVKGSRNEFFIWGNNTGIGQAKTFLGYRMFSSPNWTE